MTKRKHRPDWAAVLRMLVAEYGWHRFKAEAYWDRQPDSYRDKLIAQAKERGFWRAPETTSGRH